MGSGIGRSHAWLLKVGVAIAAVVAAGLFVAVGAVSGADQPSIASDRSEYAPGDPVVLTGAGWQAGEAVQLLVDDDQDDAWSHEAELIAMEDGSVSGSFDAPRPRRRVLGVGDRSLRYCERELHRHGERARGPPTEPVRIRPASRRATRPSRPTRPATSPALSSRSPAPASARRAMPCSGSRCRTKPRRRRRSAPTPTALGSNYTLPAPAVAGEYLVEALGGLDAVLASATFEGLEPVPGPVHLDRPGRLQARRDFRSPRQRLAARRGDPGRRGRRRRRDVAPHRRRGRRR